MPYTYSSPRWWATIRTWEGRTAKKIEVGSGRSGSDIYRFHTSVSLTGQTTLKLVLVPSKTINYLKHITVSSVVEFWIDDAQGPAMFAGFVSSVSKMRSVDEETGAESVFIHVTCIGAMEVFQRQSITYIYALKTFQANPLFYQATEAFRRAIRLGRQRQGSFYGKRPTAIEVIWSILDSYMSKAFSNALYMIPSSSRELQFLDIIDPSGFSHHPSALRYSTDFSTIKTTMGYRDLWDMIKSFSHSIINELFIDVRPRSELSRHNKIGGPVNTQFMEREGYPLPPFGTQYFFAAEDDDLLLQYGSAANMTGAENYFNTDKYSKDSWAFRLICRPRPYLVEEMGRLPRHTLDDTEIVSSEFRKSTVNIYNWYRVDPVVARFRNTFSQDASTKSYSIANLNSIAKFGLYPYEVTSTHPFYSSLLSQSAKDNSPRSVCFEQAKLIASQNYMNEVFINGSIVTATVRPHIRVGNALHLTSIRDKTPEDGPLFYIEAVSNTGTAEGETSTTAVLTRGFPLKSGEALISTFTKSKELTSKSGQLNLIVPRAPLAGVDR